VPRTLAPRVAPRRWEQVAALAAGDSAFAPVTTSVGRLFDAVSALCGLRTQVTYEGQAAFELEAVADPGERAAYPLPAGGGLLDARETVLAVLDDVRRGVPATAISARFHNALARATAAAAADAAARHGTGTAVLSGGVFQNRLLLERTAPLVTGAGLRLLVPERLPPNDGGISFGQAAVAAARLERGEA
jgi:hydrogenase maturation protein HypF